MNRKLHPVSVHQAAEASPTLARLTELARESGERLRAIESLLPAGLRSAVQPGPIEGTAWCLLVQGNAAAAKLRQVLPALQAQLCRMGWEVTAIRIRVQATRG